MAAIIEDSHEVDKQNQLFSQLMSIIIGPRILQSMVKNLRNVDISTNQPNMFIISQSWGEDFLWPKPKWIGGF